MSTSPRAKPEIVHVYDYTDEKGQILFQAIRYEPGFGGEKKTFRQRRPVKGGFAWGLSAGHYRKMRDGWTPLKAGEAPREGDLQLPECRRVLYRLPDLVQAPPDRPVFVVEGEKDAETLRGLELLATTNAMGAGKWRKEYAEVLRGRHVFILPDHDDPGRKHAAAVEKSLAGVAASVTVVELPGLPAKGDVSDWLTIPDNDKAALLALVQGAVEKVVADKEPRPPASPPPKGKAPPEPYRAFPLHALPQPLAAYVEQAAGALGCDPAYVALPVLAVVASTIGNTRVIQLKRGWREPCVVWSCIVGDSGTLKSPARALAVSRLVGLQKGHIEEFNRLRGRYLEDKARHERQKGKAASGRTAPPEEPSCMRLIVGDTTIERLADILGENPRGVLVSRDELDGWVASFARYKGRGGTDLPLWLEMFRAEALLVDRKASDRKILFVPRAAVSITGTIQPGVLRRALTPEYLEAGLGARLLLAMPPKLPKQWSEVEVHPDAQLAYEDLLDRLLALDFDDRRGERVPVAVSMSQEAKAAWVDFYNEWAAVQADADGDLAAVYSKLEAYAARFALIHHVVRRVTGQAEGDVIDAGDVQAGAALARWFAGEARRIYVALAEPEDARRVRRLVDFIRQRGGSVSARDLQRSNPGRYQTAEDAEAALDALADAGVGEWRSPPAKDTGRPPARVFRLHPTPDKTDKTPEAGGKQAFPATASGTNGVLSGSAPAGPGAYTGPDYDDDATLFGGSMAATTEPRWCGWHRPRNGAWTKVVHDAASSADCWSALLAVVAQLPSGDSCVLESFRHPGAPARPFHRGGRRLL